MHNWQLPDYVADILPSTARQVESAKATMLEGLRVAGYELVMPPMIEYMDALVGADDLTLGLKTFRLDDQLSGRQLGLRADMTPQVARIDAHLLGACQGVNRLCYAGSVVHTRPETLDGSRELLQLGAELYGYAGIAADFEIIELMLSTVRSVQVQAERLDLGHMGIFRSLSAAANLSAELRQELFFALQHKDVTYVSSLVNAIEEPYKSAFLRLPELYGPMSELKRARACLPPLPGVEFGFSQLQAIATGLEKTIDISFDLSELRGTQYHNGLLFAVYSQGWAKELARGGRYDDIGARFGRARPATGFSLDLRHFIRALPQQGALQGIRVSADYWPQAKPEVERLRKNGLRVVVDYLGESSEALKCDQELVPEANEWHLVPLN